MKQTDTEKMLQNDPELDALLDQMAEDVPPMPADFHDNWMSAIRDEAKQNVPVMEEKEEKKPVSLVRWTRILSVAAMFVFLIGGTLLYRNTKGTMMPALSAERKEAAVMTQMAVTAGEVQENAGEEAESEAYDLSKDAGDLALSASLPAAAASDAAAADAKAYGAVVNEAPALAMGTAVEEEAVYEEAEAEEEPMPMAAATSMPTAEPVPEPEGTGTAEEPETTETEQSGFLQQAGEFFTDMGDFLLAALPYLAVLAVPAVAALLLGRRKKILKK